MTDEDLQEMIDRAVCNGENAVSIDDFCNIKTKTTFT
jgi:hypothetical protein